MGFKIATFCGLKYKVESKSSLLSIEINCKNKYFPGIFGKSFSFCDQKYRKKTSVYARLLGTLEYILKVKFLGGSCAVQKKVRG